jgi:Tol biopolymer transport system component
MSPEQASAAVIDFRSDQFALGAILYEMATGKRAFQRKTAVDTLSAILNEEPEPVESLSPQAPVPLRWIVERCLAKEPEGRYGTTRDLARDLATIRDRLSETSGIGSVVRGAQRARRRALSEVILVVCVLALGLLAGKLLWKAGPPSIPRFQQITFRRGYTWYARFAPDGQTIVFSARWDGKTEYELHSTRIGSPESRSLRLPPANILSISANGQMAILLVPRPGVDVGMLAEAPLAGGAARELLADVGEADWSPDGTALAVEHLVDGNVRIEFPVGKTIFEGATRSFGLRVSPDGKWIVLRGGAGRIRLLDVSGQKKPFDLVPGTDPVWSWSGRELYFLRRPTAGQTELRAVSLSGQERVVAGLPGEFRLLDLARDGRFLMERLFARGEILGRGPDATTDRSLSWLDLSAPAGLSDDGRYLLIGERRHDAVYHRKTDGSDAVRIGSGIPLALSPDGRWALCIKDGSPPELILHPAGAGPSKNLRNTGFERFDAAGWFADGRSVWFNASRAGVTRSYSMGIDDAEPKPVLSDQVLANFVSPDGGLFVANGPNGIQIYPVDGGKPRPIRGLEEADLPLRWSADGRALFLARGSGSATRVYRLDLASGRREFLKEFAPADLTGVIAPPYVFLSADGKSWAYSYYRDFSDLYVVDGIQ